jgi:hypothetical protein
MIKTLELLVNKTQLYNLFVHSWKFVPVDVIRLVFDNGKDKIPVIEKNCYGELPSRIMLLLM